MSLINRRVFRTLSVGLLGVGAAAITVACAPADDTTTTTAPDETYTSPAVEEPSSPDEMAMGSEPETVVDVLNEEGSFTILTQALTEAELAAVLGDAGPYTVFAPTDEAFAALPEGTLDSLLLPENRQTLQALLTYHVTAGAITSDQIASGNIATLQGEPVTVEASGGDVMVGNAQVIEPDLEAGNGVVHAIDTVLLPPNLQL